MSLSLDSCWKLKLWDLEKSWKLPPFKHQKDNSEIGRKGKLALHRALFLKKVKLENFVDDNGFSITYIMHYLKSRLKMLWGNLLLQLIWFLHGLINLTYNQQPYLCYWATIIYALSSTPTNSVYFTWLYQVKHFIWMEGNAQEENTVKFDRMGWLRQMLMLKSCLCPLLENLRNQDAFQNQTLTLLKHKGRAGWVESSLKRGCVSWIRSVIMKGRNWIWQLHSTPLYWESESYDSSFPTIFITQPMDQGTIPSLKSKYNLCLSHHNSFG